MSEDLERSIVQLPQAYDFSKVSEGAVLPTDNFPVLHDFFEEEGMALHLASPACGSELYVNLPADLAAEASQHGIVGAGADVSRLHEVLLALIVQVGSPEEALNIPFIFGLLDRADCDELIALANAGDLSLRLLEGSAGNLRYRGHLSARLPEELQDELREITSAMLEQL